MDRATRDKFASRTQSEVTAGNACWETAPNVFDKLNRDFGPFDIDLTADADRALCDKWFGPGHDADDISGSRGFNVMDDALVANWIAFGRSGYSNPPYGPFINKIMRCAIYQAERGFTSTFLIPMRVTHWFKSYVLTGASGLYFCDSRLIFYEDGKPRHSINKRTGMPNTNPDTAMFDSIIVRYQPRSPGELIVPRISLWHVPDHGKEPSRRRATFQSIGA